MPNMSKKPPRTLHQILATLRELLGHLDHDSDSEQDTPAHCTFKIVLRRRIAYLEAEASRAKPEWITGYMKR